MSADRTAAPAEEVSLLATQRDAAIRAAYSLMGGHYTDADAIEELARMTNIPPSVIASVIKDQ